MERRLVSDEYRRLNAQLHQSCRQFGVTAKQHIDRVRALARRYSAKTVLDYGCGKCEIWNGLHNEFDVRNYDPALSGLDQPPDPADFVVCIDVLEHVEPVYLDDVLEDLARVTGRAGFFTIATCLARKVLPDGTNCHRIVRPMAWWCARLQTYFRLINIDPTTGGLSTIVERLK